MPASEPARPRANDGRDRQHRAGGDHRAANAEQADQRRGDDRAERQRSDLDRLLHAEHSPQHVVGGEALGEREQPGLHERESDPHRDQQRERRGAGPAAPTAANVSPATARPA
jgi:hypothetical protein